ncbi:hypothetical protein [uncultured Ruminococcus sp.]|uniref:hypothetical protein n=1 Tax=uncultured Ruminococcus sp. TaxID=165186 RepID=UPI00266C8A1D|nr:hypothetical protein [uncultured Ruminococcus sp.]
MKPHFAPKSCLHLLYHMEKDAVKHILSKAAQFHFLFLQSRRIPESTAQKHRTAPKEAARCFPFSEFYGLLIIVAINYFVNYRLPLIPEHSPGVLVAVQQCNGSSRPFSSHIERL